jgi:hypothetical protein
LECTVSQKNFMCLYQSLKDSGLDCFTLLFL